MAKDYSNPWYRDDDQSILEVYDVETGTRTVLAEFDYLIEAPNWSVDGKFLVYNSKGRVFTFDLETKESKEIDTGFEWYDQNNVDSEEIKKLLYD